MADRAALLGWEEQEPTQKVQMYSIIFQTFVFMQLFNQINARKLGEKEYNVFERFFNNPMFLGILILTFAIQIVIVQYGGRYMRTVPITWEQNGYCAAIGAFSLVWGLFLKFIPSRWFAWIRLEEKEMSAEEEQVGLVASMRKSHTLSAKKMQTSSGRNKRTSTKKVNYDGEDNYKIN